MPDFPAPIDQAVRERFTTELGRNFSVISPAGSGKTKAFTDRIAAMARRSDAPSILPTLVAVTFTQKAADEIQERARASILAQRPAPAVLNGFNRGFFGTIHSFAVSLLRIYGHHLGIPSVFEVVGDDTLLWREFLQQHSGRPSGMDSEAFATLVRVYPFQSVLSLVRSYTFSRPAPRCVKALPHPRLGEVLAFPLPKRQDTAANIRAAQTELSNWVQKLDEPDGFAPLPIPEKGGAEFLALCRTALAPVTQWIGEAIAEAVHALALDYREFRIRRGMLTFNDQVALAADLMRHGRAAREIRSRNFRVILDEAQDTDPHQFYLLTELARPADAAKGGFLDTLQDGPRAGHFCMVGDPQQSIYSERADLGHYLAIHRALLLTGAAEQLEFQVTFRCDKAIVDAANAVFPTVLNSQSGQVAYVPLCERPAAGAGQVLRVPITSPTGDDAGDDRARALHEARELGKWLRHAGLDGLRAQHWNEVALLCPRKDWFGALRAGLAESGLQIEYQSTREVNGDSPAFAWMTALCTVFAEPGNALEVFGVLREVFALSDHDIAVFAQKDPAKLRVSATTEKGPVADAIRQLAAARACFTRSSLREALGEALQMLNLKGRLLSLPADEFPSLGDELETLLLRASEAEASGCTLEEFCATLRADFGQRVETETCPEDSLPVITNLKAKGLQWDCVVLAFFGRAISFRSAAYPRFLPAGCPRPVAISADDTPTEWLTRMEAGRAQEIERLLYVSFTRPKRTLVLPDDVGIWAKDAMAVKNSLAAATRVSAENCAFWTSLGDTAMPIVSDTTAQVAPTEEPSRYQVLPLSEKFMERMLRFPRRVLPHTLGTGHVCGRKIEDPEQRTTVAADTLRADMEESEGVRYGSWWHAVMQSLPWDGKDEEVAATIAAMLPSCPQPIRARNELQTFLLSDLYAMLREPGNQIYTEFPFMAPLHGGDSLDGVIDLVVRFTATKRWAVIDWKTNRGAALAEIVTRYRPQVRSYSDSMAAITGEEVDGIVYSTAAGCHALV